MPVRLPTLRVLPNPWTYIDHNGRPAGTCPCDPYEHTPRPGAKVGARLASVETVRQPETRVIAGRPTIAVAGDYYPTWSFDTEPVEIPNTAYYRERLVGGDLIAADDATAKAAGLKFSDPANDLEFARLTAIAQFDAENGEGAFAQLNPAPATEPQPSNPARPTKRKSDEG